MRVEFKKLYLQTPLHIHIHALGAYLELFYPITGPLSEETNKLCFDLAINTVSQRDPYPPYYPSAFDIKPMLQHLYQLAGAAITFVPRSRFSGTAFIPDHALNTIFSDHKSIWDIYFTTTQEIESVAFFYYHYSTTKRNVEIQLALNAAETRHYLNGNFTPLNDLLAENNGHARVAVKVLDPWLKEVESPDAPLYRAKGDTGLKTMLVDRERQSEWEEEQEWLGQMRRREMVAETESRNSVKRKRADVGVAFTVPDVDDDRAAGSSEDWWAYVTRTGAPSDDWWVSVIREHAERGNSTSSGRSPVQSSTYRMGLPP
ncbi:hypothetical protein BU23DRAFT_629073 [Bimuria novae-zelandiae CBS 107.79]|uniref:Uncharacterized protein n=1 Tax=Bimuria novae-zelandiae CBS 107.79 TaxID=1447943 RepID=A0A6A5UQB6_9PLEO|nr:hypothetical protein BU23DRAFT_629073 [Bimuria novae-zelandiae CBS 107.79]